MASESESARAAAVALRHGVVSLGRRLRMERTLSTAEPTMLELSVLGHLNRRGPLTPGELAAADKVQPQSLTRTLTSLESAQFVSRKPDPADGRRSLLAITPAGYEALRRTMAQRDVWLAAAMAAQLTPTEIELLRLAGDLMDRLAAASPLIP